MSGEPKKRGRPKKTDKNTEILPDLTKLTEEQKQQLLAMLAPKTNKKTSKVFINKFVDNGELCQEDREFTKKVKFSVSPRDRPNNVKESKCDKCGASFLNYGAEYLCNDCGSKK